MRRISYVKYMCITDYDYIGGSYSEIVTEAEAHWRLLKEAIYGLHNVARVTAVVIWIRSGI